MSPRKSFWWMLPLSSGVLLWLSFPKFGLFPLTWVALVPYLLFLLRVPSWKRTVAGHLWLAVPYFAGVLYWIPRVMQVYGGIPWFLSLLLLLGLVIVLAGFLFPFTALTRLAAGRNPQLALWVAPGFWLVTEVLRNYLVANGFPWALLGYSQFSYGWIIQIADLGGVYLVSLLLVASSSVLVAAFQLGRWKPLLAFLILFAASNLYGIYRLEMWRPPQGRAVRVALVQPGIELSEPLEHYARKYFEELPDYYRRAVEQGAEWVVFPEAQNPYSYGDFYFRTFWERQVKSGGASLLFNSSTQDPGSQSYYNSALLLDPAGTLAYRYDKMELVPFGEYVPFRRWLPFVHPMIQEVSSFTPGERVSVGKMGDLRFGTLVCFESIFPELSAAFVQEGAEVLVNLTNDSWFGDTAAPDQHLQMAAFRAIETRKPLLRAANSGYSAVVGPEGRIRQKIDLFEEGMIVAETAGNSYRTIYSYLGEWLNITVIVLSGTALLLSRASRSRRKKRGI